MAKQNLPQEEWRQDSPRGLCTAAKEFRDVGQDALAAHMNRVQSNSNLSLPVEVQMECGIASPASFPIYYNFLHAIELLLKAYLRHVDAVPLKELRHQPYRHNISKLLEVSIEKEICSHCNLNSDQIDAIHEVSCEYSTKRLEYFYLRLTTPPKISIKRIADATDTLVDGIDDMDLRISKDPNSP